MEEEYQKTIDFAEPMLADSKTKNLDEIKHIVGQAHFELGHYFYEVYVLLFIHFVIWAFLAIMLTEAPLNPCSANKT